jgi:hypothetical protein
MFGVPVIFDLVIPALKLAGRLLAWAFVAMLMFSAVALVFFLGVVPQGQP